jgi:hypothetical protein
MDSKSAVFLTCAAVSWTAAGFKVAALRRDPRDPALWALTASILLPAAGFTMAAPVIYPHVSAAFGIPNFATLLVYCCIVGYSVSALIMLLLWHLPAAQARRRALGLLYFYGLVLVALVPLFMNSGATTDRPADFDVVYGPRPVGGSFLLVYVGAFAVGLTAAAVRGFQFAARVARSGGHPWLRRGLRLVASGSIVALGYCLGKAAFVLAAWSGVMLPAVSKLATLCACVGAMIITTGFTIPSWGPRLSAATTWIGRVRAYRRLQPLWQTMYDAVPDIALEPSDTRAGDLALRDLEFRLYRRLIEIRDGRLALAAYMPAIDDSQAEQLARQHRLPVDPVREALQIRVAAHHVRETPAGAQVQVPGGVDGAPGHGDTELAWLVQVSTALRRLPAHSEAAAPVPVPER